MDLKQKLLNISKCVICGIGVLLTFYTIIDLMLFLSNPHKIRLTGYPRKDEWLTISWSLLVDMFLLSCFVVQHSLLASPRVKAFFQNYGLEDMYRSFYIITTSIVLQIMLSQWLAIPEITLWKLNLSNNYVWWLYFGIHGFAWTLIYVGNICMDINELLGIKQVIYAIQHLPEPHKRKSQQLNKLYNHIRHPSFLAFVLLFWVNSIMSLDQILLATILTAFMYLAWNTDGEDYDYQKNQYEMKFHEIQRMRS